MVDHFDPNVSSAYAGASCYGTGDPRQHQKFAAEFNKVADIAEKACNVDNGSDVCHQAVKMMDDLMDHPI